MRFRFALGYMKSNPMPEDVPPEEADERRTRELQAALATLFQWFDTIQIFVSRIDPKDQKTHYEAAGQGNWMARSGQVREWLIVQDEVLRENARQDCNRDE